MNNTSQPQKIWWTIKDLSYQTGWTLKTIYNMVHRGQLPYYKPNGGRILFNAEEINEHIKKTRQCSTQSEK